MEKREKRTRAAMGMALAWFVWLCIGCVKVPVATEQPTVDWDQVASGAYQNDQGRTFYGIGKAAGLHSASLLRASADNAAQAELLQVLKAYTASLAEAAGVTTADEADRQALVALVQQAAQQAQIVDHRYDGEAGTLMALCRLDLADFKQILEGIDQFDPAARKAMLSMADKVHDRMGAR